MKKEYKRPVFTSISIKLGVFGEYGSTPGGGGHDHDDDDHDHHGPRHHWGWWGGWC